MKRDIHRMMIWLCVLAGMSLLVARGLAAPITRADTEIPLSFVIERFAIVTSMKVTPQTINAESGKGCCSCGCPLDRPLVMATLCVPDYLREKALWLGTITINGRRIDVRRPPQPMGPDAWTDDAVIMRNDTLHLHFDREEFLACLGGPGGVRIVTFEAEVGEGHYLLTAQDTVRLIKMPNAYNGSSLIAID